MCPGHEVRSGMGHGQCGQRRAQALGVLLKPAAPELTALVRHSRLGGRRSRGFESAAVQQTGDEKQGDHGNTETQKRQGELRQ
jgi:hypothetical protein